ncbi:ankyrin repeat domain-containing protein 28 [Metarhizium brunneum]
MASAPETPVGEECIAVKIMDSDRTPSIPSSVDMNATQDISNEIVGHHIISSNYAPQFDSAAAFILSRIRDTNDNFKPPRRGSSGILNKLGRKGGMVEAMDSWTMPLPNAPTPALSLTSTLHQEQLASISSSLKRKRDPESEAPDFTQSTIACPESMVHSQSKVIASAQPSTAESSTPKTASGNLHSSISLSGQAAVENIREKRLSAITDGISPAKSELVGFYAGQASDIVRTQYFLGKRRTDLLNILSFCDQLRPQLLADILVSVSKKHPDLPIFDSPDWQRPISRSLDAQIAAAVRRARPAGRPRHGHTVLNPKSRQRQKNAKKALKRLIRAEHEVDTPEDEDVEEDVLPSTWPKAGEGLYSKLPPETEDRTFLADDNDDESFSHFMVDNLGKPMIVSTCA